MLPARVPWKQLPRPLRRDSKTAGRKSSLLIRMCLWCFVSRRPSKAAAELPPGYLAPPPNGIPGRGSQQQQF